MPVGANGDAADSVFAAADAAIAELPAGVLAPEAEIVKELLLRKHADLSVAIIPPADGGAVAAHILVP